MKINNFEYPKSSFLGMEKDLSLIVNKILKNERLKKLLFYTTADALSRPNLTEEETRVLFEKNIKLVPKLYVDGSVLTYIIISFDNFIQSSNPEFRDSTIEFDIICHFDQWNLTDCQLRPYKIAAEIDSMIDKGRLTGIGKTEFLGATQFTLTDEYAGLCLMYKVWHGGEDKKKAENPVEQADIEENFYKMLNE